MPGFVATKNKKAPPPGYLIQAFDCCARKFSEVALDGQGLPQHHANQQRSVKSGDYGTASSSKGDGSKIDVGGDDWAENDQASDATKAKQRLADARERALQQRAAASKRRVGSQLHAEDPAVETHAEQRSLLAPELGGDASTKTAKERFAADQRARDKADAMAEEVAAAEAERRVQDQVYQTGCCSSRGEPTAAWRKAHPTTEAQRHKYKYDQTRTKVLDANGPEIQAAREQARAQVLQSHDDRLDDGSSSSSPQQAAVLSPDEISLENHDESVDKLKMLLQNVKHKRRAKKATMLKDALIENAARRDMDRLMIYSSDTPDIDDFASMIRCQKARYEFDTDGVERLQEIITDAVAQNFGKPLKSIALACHGPPPDADGEADDAGGPEEIFHWPITKTIVVSDDTDLVDKQHAARKIVDALAAGVETGSGRVDLLACSLLKSKEGQEVFDAIERETGCNFAASDNATGNPKDGGDWVMESDNVDIKDFYFWSTDEFDGRFAAHNLGRKLAAINAKDVGDDDLTAAEAEKSAQKEAKAAEWAETMKQRRRYEEQKARETEERKQHELLRAKRATELKAKKAADAAAAAHQAALQSAEDERVAVLQAEARKAEEQAAADTKARAEAEATVKAEKDAQAALIRQAADEYELGQADVAADDYEGGIGHFEKGLAIKHGDFALADKISAAIDAAVIAEEKHHAVLLAAAKANRDRQVKEAAAAEKQAAMAAEGPQATTLLSEAEPEPSSTRTGAGGTPPRQRGTPPRQGTPPRDEQQLDNTANDADAAIQVEDDKKTKAANERVQSIQRDIDAALDREIPFLRNKAIMAPEGHAVVDAVAKVLCAYPFAHILVDGHCNGKKNTPYLQKLSNDRATTVKDELCTHADVTADRIAVRGSGAAGRGMHVFITVEKIDEDERAEILDDVSMFDVIDLDEDGRISWDEFAVCIKPGGVVHELLGGIDDTIHNMLRADWLASDADASGDLDRHEFDVLMFRLKNHLVREAHFHHHDGTVVIGEYDAEIQAYIDEAEQDYKQGNFDAGDHAMAEAERLQILARSNVVPQAEAELKVKATSQRVAAAKGKLKAAVTANAAGVVLHETAVAAATLAANEAEKLRLQEMERIRLEKAEQEKLRLAEEVSRAEAEAAKAAAAKEASLKAEHEAAAHEAEMLRQEAAAAKADEEAAQAAAAEAATAEAKAKAEAEAAAAKAEKEKAAAAEAERKAAEEAAQAEAEAKAAEEAAAAAKAANDAAAAAKAAAEAEAAARAIKEAEEAAAKAAEEAAAAKAAEEAAEKLKAKAKAQHVATARAKLKAAVSANAAKHYIHETAAAAAAAKAEKEKAVAAEAERKAAEEAAQAEAEAKAAEEAAAAAKAANDAAAAAKAAAEAEAAARAIKEAEEAAAKAAEEAAAAKAAEEKEKLRLQELERIRLETAEREKLQLAEEVSRAEAATPKAELAEVAKQEAEAKDERDRAAQARLAAAREAAAQDETKKQAAEAEAAEANIRAREAKQHAEAVARKKAIQDEINLELEACNSNIPFERNKPIMQKSGYPVIEAVSKVLAKYPYVHILIDGHCTGKKNTPHLQKLSEERAHAVKDALSHPGVKKDHLTTRGSGAAGRGMHVFITVDRIDESERAAVLEEVDLFDVIDSDVSERISWDEFAMSLQPGGVTHKLLGGFDPTLASTLRANWLAADDDGSGDLDREEFETLVVRLKGHMLRRATEASTEQLTRQWADDIAFHLFQAEQYFASGHVEQGEKSLAAAERLQGLTEASHESIQDEINSALHETIPFIQGQAVMEEVGPEIIHKVVSVLQRYPFVHVSVDGHAGKKGRKNTPHLQQLSLDRAKAVKEELTRQGIAKNHIKAKGHGAGKGMKVLVTVDRIDESERQKLAEQDAQLSKTEGGAGTQSLFDAVDTDRSDRISWEEFAASVEPCGAVFKLLGGFDPELKAALVAAWQAADVDGSGDLDRLEFHHLIDNLYSASKSEAGSNAITVTALPTLTC